MYLSVMRVFRHVLNTILSKEQKTAQYEIYHNWRIYTLTIYMIKIRMMTLRSKKNFLLLNKRFTGGLRCHSSGFGQNGFLASKMLLDQG